MTKSLKILMLEDSHTDAEIVQRVLKRDYQPCIFHLAMSEESFIKALDSFQPDVILADNSLPQFDAAKALIITRQHKLEIPFIMVTGTMSEEFAAGIIKSGADDYILKDRLARLPAAIDAALKQRSSEKEKKEAEQKILQSEIHLRAIFENTSEGFLLMDTDGIVKKLNSKAGEYSFFNQDREIQVGHPIYDFIEEERKTVFKKILSKVLEGNTVEYQRSFEMGDGNTRWLDFSVTPVWESGNINGICISGRDITAQKTAEEKLNKNFIEKQALAQRMSAILNTLPANIALLNENGIIVDINDAWRNFADDNGFIGNNYGIGDDYIVITKKSVGNGKADGLAVAEGIESVLKDKVKEFVFEYACHSPALKRWFRMVVSPLQGKEYLGAVVMHIDISEIRKLEKERLENKINEQKKVTKAMLQAQENERNAIGIELHDNVNQILVGTNMLLRMVKENPKKIEELLPSCIENIKSAIQENRKIAHELVAPDLGAETLLQQLFRLNQTMLETAGMETFTLHDDYSETLLSDDLKLAVYRVMQEQYTNIIKHANARKVEITLSTIANIFTLRIIDDGKGMLNNNITNGIGLRNIKSRISVFEGIVNIESMPDKGFALNIEVPIL